MRAGKPGGPAGPRPAAPAWKRTREIMRSRLWRRNVAPALAAVMTAGLLTAGCSSGGSTANAGSTQYPDDDNRKRAGGDTTYSQPGSLFGEGGLTFGGGGDEAPAGGTGIGVNSFLWRASLDGTVRSNGFRRYSSREYASGPVYSRENRSQATGMTTTPTHWTSDQNTFDASVGASSSRTKKTDHQVCPASIATSGLPPGSLRSRQASIAAVMPTVMVTSVTSSNSVSGLTAGTVLRPNRLLCH